MDIDHVPVRGTKPLSEVYMKVDITTVEPTNFEEAQAQEGWRQPMLDDMNMIHKNQTWDLVARLVHRKVIGVKWVFRAKQNADGTLNKLKVRLVVKGFSQKYEIDYFETFAPVARLDTIRLLVALWKIHQLDVKSGFLNGFLDEKIYVEQSEGLNVQAKKGHVWLKGGTKGWYDRIDSYLASLGFERSLNEPTLYVKKEGDETLLIVSFYVNDLLMTGGNDAMLTNFKGKMRSMFEMSDLGEMSYFLGMEAFALQSLNRFSMQNCKATSTSVAVREKLSATRPDIMFAISLLSRFMHCCNVNHFQAAKRVLRYIKGTLSFEVMFTKVNNMKLLDFADSDWAGSIDEMKSTSRYLYTLGSTIFCCSSKNQSIVAQSIVEAEYVVAAAAIN
ncbi:Retrovirus-related Pol polyprotein from transposon TNT 1-94 [Gossypium australe]|uniref:Retrovirus-related Pol polyprotein from transposon TNT 1-94 n=1 Tax=Gossypium australe TaxID=47621 RepID=A0A5B6VEC8_9ROSI|nr:Retrovirus-related Pol polyprotein from transposon TNT 1-94 [Gossypium australe]